MTNFAFASLEGSDPLPEGWTGYVKLMFVLCAILVSAFLIVRFWLPKMTPLAKFSSGPIRILARFPLEPRKTLYLVGVGKNVMLMASSEAGIQPITMLNPDDWDEIQTPTGGGSLTEGSFVRLINSIRPGRKR